MRYLKKKKSTATIAILLLFTIHLTTPGNQSRIKDIARIAGLENMNLIGYGVVVGLAGSGDKDIELSKQTIANMLEHFSARQW